MKRNKEKKKLDKYMEKFAGEVVKLPVQEFLGLLTVCGIDLFKDSERKESKSAEELFDELLTRVYGMSIIKRKNVMMILKSANKDRGRK